MPSGSVERRDPRRVTMQIAGRELLRRVRARADRGSRPRRRSWPAMATGSRRLRRRRCARRRHVAWRCARAAQLGEDFDQQAIAVAGRRAAAVRDRVRAPPRVASGADIRSGEAARCRSGGVGVSARSAPIAGGVAAFELALEAARATPSGPCGRGVGQRLLRRRARTCAAAQSSSHGSMRRPCRISIRNPSGHARRGASNSGVRLIRHRRQSRRSTTTVRSSANRVSRRASQPRDHRRAEAPGAVGIAAASRTRSRPARRTARRRVLGLGDAVAVEHRARRPGRGSSSAASYVACSNMPSAMPPVVSRSNAPSARLQQRRLLPGVDVGQLAGARLEHARRTA